MSFSNSHIYVFTWCYILQLTFWSTRCGVCEHSWLGLLSHFTSAAGHKRSQGSWRYGPELSNDFVILPLIKQVVWRGNIIENMNRRILMSRKSRYGQKKQCWRVYFPKRIKLQLARTAAWHQRLWPFPIFWQLLHHNILKGLFWIVLQECFRSGEYVIWLNASAPGDQNRAK